MAHAITVNRKQVLLVEKIPDLYLTEVFLQLSTNSNYAH